MRKLFQPMLVIIIYLIIGCEEVDETPPVVSILTPAANSTVSETINIQVSASDEKALEKALVSGKVSGAWLDTFEGEPYTGNLSKYNQVILTPHIGSYTFEGRMKMELESVKNLLDGFKL